MLTRYIRTLLYNVHPHDPMTFVAVPLVLIAVAVLACWRAMCPRAGRRGSSRWVALRGE